jgi:glycine/D-amino acid oxidase-like deaminating enzyme
MIETEDRQSAGWGVDLELLDEPAARRLMPAIEGSGFTAICHTPGDMYIEEPATLLQAWLAALEKLKVEVRGNLPVTGVLVSNGEVKGVSTSYGNIDAPVVVDAAGAWARAIGDTGGGAVPACPVRHQLLITEPIDGVAEEQPILRIVDTAVYVRPARGGLMVGGFEPDPLPIDPRVEAPSFSIDDVPLDLAVLDRLTATIDRHGHRSVARRVDRCRQPVNRHLVAIAHALRSRPD